MKGKRHGLGDAFKDGIVKASESEKIGAEIKAAITPKKERKDPGRFSAAEMRAAEYPSYGFFIAQIKVKDASVADMAKAAGVTEDEIKSLLREYSIDYQSRFSRDRIRGTSPPPG